MKELLQLFTFLIIFVKILEVLNHLSEIISYERIYSDSQEHVKGTYNPFVIRYGIVVAKSHL